MSIFSSIWLIGYLFYFGWQVGGTNVKRNKPLDNWATAIYALVFWPIMLGYDVRTR